MRKITKQGIDKFKKQSLESIEFFCNEVEGEIDINYVAYQVNYLTAQINKLSIILLVGKEILEQEGYDENGRQR